MRHHFIIGLVVLFSFMCLKNSAQTTQNSYLKIQQLTGEPFMNNYLMYDNNPFYMGDWIKGTVVLNSGLEFTGLDLKFDTYRNQIIYFNTFNKAMVVIDNETIEQFTLINASGEAELFKKLKIDPTDPRKDKYYSIIVEDNISLVLLYEAFVDNYTSANPGNKKIGKFENKKHYFYLQNNHLTQLPRFKPAVMKHFPGMETDLKNYIRKNHLKIRKKEHLELIFKEINRLNMAK